MFLQIPSHPSISDGFQYVPSLSLFRIGANIRVVMCTDSNFKITYRHQHCFPCWIQEIIVPSCPKKGVNVCIKKLELQSHFRWTSPGLCFWLHRYRRALPIRQHTARFAISEVCNACIVHNRRTYRDISVERVNKRILICWMMMMVQNFPGHTHLNDFRRVHVDF